VAEFVFLWLSYLWEKGSRWGVTCDAAKQIKGIEVFASSLVRFSSADENMGNDELENMDNGELDNHNMDNGELEELG
jgi:hypothetical protein